jgi:hypothetical protein
MRARRPPLVPMASEDARCCWCQGSHTSTSGDVVCGSVNPRRERHALAPDSRTRRRLAPWCPGHCSSGGGILPAGPRRARLKPPGRAGRADFGPQWAPQLGLARGWGSTARIYGQCSDCAQVNVGLKGWAYKDGSVYWELRRILDHLKSGFAKTFRVHQEAWPLCRWLCRSHGSAGHRPSTGHGTLGRHAALHAFPRTSRADRA